MNLLIFDLDGTLIDSKADLVQAVNATRRWMKLPTLDDERIASYVGNGAPMLIRRALGPEASEEDNKRALEYFLEYYAEHKLDYTQAYPGVPEALEILSDAGVKMAVLTNKPVRVSNGILEGLGLARHFERIYGGNSFERKKPDPIGVDALLKELHIPRDRTLMVGDSAVDVRTARNAEIKVCGVTYGFQPESFLDDPPDFTVDRMEQLANAVVEGRKIRGAA